MVSEDYDWRLGLDAQASPASPTGPAPGKWGNSVQRRVDYTPGPREAGTGATAKLRRLALRKRRLQHLGLAAGRAGREVQASRLRMALQREEKDPGWARVLAAPDHLLELLVDRARKD